jgi:hypothetical protein
LARAGQVDEQAGDVFLGQGVLAGLFADVNALGIRPRPAEQPRGRQVVINDGVGPSEEVPPPQGEQGGVAGPGPDEINRAEGALAACFACPGFG